jgi:hypothetical protein
MYIVSLHEKKIARVQGLRFLNFKVLYIRLVFTWRYEKPAEPPHAPS